MLRFNPLSSRFGPSVLPRIVIVVLAASCVGGCDQKWRSKKVTLRVVDQDTRQPIDGATVGVRHKTLYMTFPPPPNDYFEAETDADGLVTLKVYGTTTSWNADGRPTHAFGTVGDVTTPEGSYGPVDTGNTGGAIPVLGLGTADPEAVRMSVIKQTGRVGKRAYDYTILMPKNDSPPAGTQ